MKHLLFVALTLATAAATSAQIPNGLYEGREGDGKPYYHHNLLLVDNDSLFLYKTPLIKEKGKILNSASDGGFYYFYGTAARTDTNTIIHLIQHNCDYCPRRVHIDSSTGFLFPIPRRDSFWLSHTPTGFTIGKVAYRRSNTLLSDFPPRSVFYPDADSNDIYRYDPKGQYQLISTGIKNFLQTDSLILDHDTLRICLDRTRYDSRVVEILDPAMIRLDTANIKLCFYTTDELKQLTATSTRPVRYMKVEDIIDYWKAARISFTYVISLPKSIHHFSEHQYRALFEYKKVANEYVLLGKPKPSGWALVE